MNANVLISSHGSIVLFEPLTAFAAVWIEDHVDPQAQWFGGALVVEHRFAPDIASALCADGFAVEVR